MTRMTPREKSPDIAFPIAGGGRWRLSEQTPEAFTLLAIFRHRHCGYCKRQISALDMLAPRFAEIGVALVAAAAQSADNAAALVEDWGIRNLPVGYDFPFDLADPLDLYVSSARKDAEPTRFLEPGLFLFKPDQSLFFASTQNMPFGRPALEDMLDAIPKAIKNGVSARGELALSKDGAGI